MKNQYIFLKYLLALSFIFFSFQPNANSEDEYNVTLKEGDKIRFSTKEHKRKQLIGTFVNYDNDSIYINLEQKSIPNVVHINSIERLQVSGGIKNYSTEFAITFGGIGALVAKLQKNNSLGGKITVKESEKTMFYVTRILLGSFLGFVVGHSTKSDIWKKVPLDKINLSLDFAPKDSNQLGFSLSLNF